MPVVERTCNETDLVEVIRFFDRPTQPCFIAKGLQRNVYFDVPVSYCSDDQKRTKAVFDEKMNKLKEKDKDGTIIKIKKLPKLDLKIAKTLDPGCNFSLFNSHHVRCADEIIDILLNAKPGDLLSTCCQLQLAGLNPYMFVYALSVALMNHPDPNISKIPIPSGIGHVPEFYLPYGVIAKAEREANLFKDDQKREPTKVDIPHTATDVEVENRVAYFREDIGINLHHWHWHLVYPSSSNVKISDKSGKMKSLADKDRRGELFFYMHQQVLARYNAERLCNKLLRTVSFSNLREPIDLAYFPKLTAPYMTFNWASRPAGVVLKDLNRSETGNFSILHMEMWRRRIMDAIQEGQYLKSDGNKEAFTEETGINVVGNMVEASELSPHKNYYGTLHNMGHDMIAFCHDPDKRYLESLGPIGNNRTAMLDPMFYRWHTHIDDIFQEYKKTLPSYKYEQLNYEGVNIVSFKVTTCEDSELSRDPCIENCLYTFIKEDLINLAHGISVEKGGCVYVKYPHLQHKEFKYEINVMNQGPERMGTVRIFLAPALDEKSEPFTLSEQRKLFIELDKFTVKLGENEKTTITRLSKDSSVTISWEQLYLDIDKILPDPTNPGNTENTQNAICGCGWPDYMLIPKGDEVGYRCKLFVMISNYENDKVSDEGTASTTEECNKKCLKPAPSYCGLRSQLYPDKRAMGYPFDRPFSKEVEQEKKIINESKFLLSNMAVQNITIKFDKKQKGRGGAGTK